MNNTIDHPLVAAYLDAVARETAQLPAERRAELLADLREHIEASGAEGEQQVRAVLADLGEPRTVAASAFAEESDENRAGAVGEPARAGRPRLTVVLLATTSVAFLVNGFLGALVLIAGLALLWPSPLWSTRHKLIGTVTSATPALLFIGALALGGGRIGPTELLLIVLFSLGVPLVGAVVLMRALRR